MAVPFIYVFNAFKYVIHVCQKSFGGYERKVVCAYKAEYAHADIGWRGRIGAALVRFGLVVVGRQKRVFCDAQFVKKAPCASCELYKLRRFVIGEFVALVLLVETVCGEGGA